MEAELWELMGNGNVRGLAKRLSRNWRAYELGHLETGEKRLEPDALLPETWDVDRPLRGLPGVPDGWLYIGGPGGDGGGEEGR